MELEINIDFFKELIVPAPNTVLNKLALDLNKFRDQSITIGYKRLLINKKNFFIVYGRNHLLEHKAIIEELIGREKLVRL